MNKKQKELLAQLNAEWREVVLIENGKEVRKKILFLKSRKVTKKASG